MSESICDLLELLWKPQTLCSRICDNANQETSAATNYATLGNVY